MTFGPPLICEVSIKFTQTESSQTFFCTFTCANWINLFGITDLYDEIYKWFNLLISQHHKIVGFVIMPNHLHMLLYIGNDDYVINTVLANGKRFLAYEIVKRLKASERNDILLTLARKVTPEERKRKKLHRVFEMSSDIKPCYSGEFILQKLEYMHANPVQGKWQLCKNVTDYLHSSASFYLLDHEHPKVKITHYADL